MIFGPEMIEKVLSGKKTETRRPVKPGETECRYKVDGGPGGSYAVQPGRGKHELGRIEVFYTRRERLRDIDKWGAIAEGFTGEALTSAARISPVEQFFLYWKRLHGEPADVDREVWVIGFELVPRKKGGASLLALGAGAL